LGKDNITQYIILGLLTHENLSGYDLKKQIDMMISQFWNVGYGQLYPSLKVLEKEGAVSGHAEPSALGPERTVYVITEKGRNQLEEWLRQPVKKEYVRYEILLKTFFGGLLPPQETRARIADFRSRNSESLQLLTQFENNLKGVLPEDQDHLYFLLTVLFGKHVYQAYLDWAEEADQMIANYFNQKESR
jgi:DNA-binding PadR family transcriptional regulator